MRRAGFIILFLVVVGVVAGSRWTRLYKSDAIHPKKPTDIYLYKDINLQKMAHFAVDSLHLSDNKIQFKWAANLLGWHSFKTGHYRINHDMTYNAFLEKIAKGNQDPVSITIIPGRRKNRIISTIVERMKFDSSAIYHLIQDSVFLHQFSVNDTTLVGHLFPETYRFYWTASPKTVLTQIFNEFDQNVTKQFAARLREMNLSESEILALASIIEGEASHDDEMAMISGLYWNRLKKNMKLQADPTVEFALKAHRRLTFDDYEVESPYNTYLHPGLPPGPINNPSESAIKAALFPANNGYLYMVARPNGYHAFSKTYAKHQQQSEKWRQYLEKQEKKAAKDSTGS